MAFGKLIIRTESGDYQEYELTKPTTSVGRQAGNDIVLNTSAVSRYHAQFEAAGGLVYLVDLGTVNGTFVNDQQVEPNSRVALSDGDVIMLGDVLLLFRVPEVRGRPSISLTPTSVPVESPHLPFRLMLDEPQQLVAPGARLQLALLIENLGSGETTYAISVGGMEREWVKLGLREVTLGPGDQSEIMITIQPPRSTQTRPGRYPLTVRVAMKDDPNRALEAVREIDVVGYSALAMVVQEGRQNGLYHLAVQNQGNMPTGIQLGGYNRERLLSYHFQPQRLQLAPGETQQVTLRVRPRGGRPFGQSRQIEFAVVARSLNRAGYHAPVSAHYTLTPSWPLWLATAGLPLVLGAGLTIILLVVALFYFRILPLPSFWGGMPATPTPTLEPTSTPLPPTPTLVPTPAAEIVDFSVEPSNVWYRVVGRVVFKWQVENVVGLSLTDQSGRLVELTADNLSTRRYELASEILNVGQHTYTLTVNGADGVPQRRSVVFEVVPVYCRISGTDVQLFSQPDPAAVPATPAQLVDVIIAGRNADASWLLVNYNDFQSLSVSGWLPASQVACPPSSPSFDQFVVVETNVVSPAGSGGVISTAEPPLTPTP
jgi:pSer/pThr/pTyr-binding forkhead associated (FHA) protein